MKGKGLCLVEVSTKHVRIQTRVHNPMCPVETFIEYIIQATSKIKLNYKLCIYGTPEYLIIFLLNSFLIFALFFAFNALMWFPIK